MKKVIRRIKYWFKKIPSWKECKHASCWDGSNAQRRMMNILSPNMTDAKFKEYLKWMRDRGCDTAHVFLVNGGDGENAGYNCAMDAWHAKNAHNRIRKLFLEGFAIVPWIIADDSTNYIRDLFAHPEERVKALADAGLFDHASFVCIGLEMDEAGGGATGWPKVGAALRKVYKGPLATHHCSGNGFRYAGLGEIVCGQLEPRAATYAAIKNQILAIKSLGKEAVGYEYDRHANRDRAQAALDAGAFGVGNW